MREEEILTLARSQIGVREDPIGSNRVKYNTEYYGMEVRGRQYPWCCVFQWWLFHALGGDGLFYGGGETASRTGLYRVFLKGGEGGEPAGGGPGGLGVFFLVLIHNSPPTRQAEKSDGAFCL